MKLSMFKPHNYNHSRLTRGITTTGDIRLRKAKSPVKRSFATAGESKSKLDFLKPITGFFHSLVETFKDIKMSGPMK